MQKISRDPLVMIDVDGTLVRDIRPSPLDTTPSKYVFIYINNMEHSKVRMDKNIQLLKDMHARGRCIIVWSAAGADWAEAVVKALQLEQYVDYVMEKPIAYVDDLQAADFMGQRIFLHD